MYFSPLPFLFPPQIFLLLLFPPKFLLPIYILVSLSSFSLILILFPSQASCSMSQFALGKRFPFQGYECRSALECHRFLINADGNQGCFRYVMSLINKLVLFWIESCNKITYSRSYPTIGFNNENWTKIGSKIHPYTIFIGAGIDSTFWRFLCMIFSRFLMDWIDLVAFYCTPWKPRKNLGFRVPSQSWFFWGRVLLYWQPHWQVGLCERIRCYVFNTEQILL